MIFAKVLTAAGAGHCDMGGTFISVKQATGTLIINTNQGEQFQLQSGDVHEFSEEFAGFDVLSSTASDSIILNVGRGKDRSSGAAAGGSGAGPVASDAYSEAVGDKTISGTSATGIGPSVLTQGKGGLLLIPVQVSGPGGVTFQILAGGRAIGCRDLTSEIFYPPYFNIPYNADHIIEVDAKGHTSISANFSGGTFNFLYVLTNDSRISNVTAALLPTANRDEQVYTLTGAQVAGEIQIVPADNTHTSYVVFGVEMSTDTAARLMVHSQNAETSGANCNAITGGYLPANGGSVWNPAFGHIYSSTYPIYLNLSANANVSVIVRFMAI